MSSTASRVSIWTITMVSGWPAQRLADRHPAGNRVGARISSSPAPRGGYFTARTICSTWRASSRGAPSRPGAASSVRAMKGYEKSGTRTMGVMPPSGHLHHVGDSLQAETSHARVQK